MKRPREESPLTSPTSGEDISDEGIATLIALLNETDAKTFDPATTTHQTSAKTFDPLITTRKNADQTSAKTTDQTSAKSKYQTSAKHTDQTSAKSTPLVNVHGTQLELDSQMLYDMIDG